LPPPIRKSVHFRNRLLLLLPPTIATRPRQLPTSRHRAGGASSSQLEDPIPPPLHHSSYPPSTQALTSFNGLNHHSPSPPLLWPFNHPSPPPETPPSPYKRAPPPRSIPHLSRPSPALLPSSSLASISASTAARSTPLRAHLRPSSASPTSPPASPSSPTPPWLLTLSFSTLKHHSGESSVAPPLPHPHLL
jgi:hypothetical protein